MIIQLEYMKPYLDIEGMRRGFYTDKYFLNVQEILSTLTKEKNKDFTVGSIDSITSIGESIVEMQVFTRRPGRTIICGTNYALGCLKYCTGYWMDQDFIDTSGELEVWAVNEGDTTIFNGDPSQITPVLKIRGRYKDFAITETLILGYLSRASRIATNIYELLVAANGKPILFFPARYDLPEAQTVDGYAYKIAIDAYNRRHNKNVKPFISTDAQGRLISLKGGGTIPHAVIACFLGDTVATTLAFAHIIPSDVNRVALVDFDNDSVKTSKEVTREMFAQYLTHLKLGSKEARKFKLYGVRLDTSSALRDASVPDTGNPKVDNGVTPTLVRLVREGINSAWKEWGLPNDESLIAEHYCEDVKIIVSGGFNQNKIRWFEEEKVPVDVYAVGSAAFDNHGPTVTDFTADVVRVKVDGKWVNMAKVGRRPNENSDLTRIW